MSEELPLIDANLENYLEATFTYVYNFKNFFIVATDIHPLNSHSDATAQIIWKEMVKMVKTYLGKGSSDKFMNELRSNFIFAYGSSDELKYQELYILTKYQKKTISIYNQWMLHYKYTNSDIFINQLDTNSWRPYGINEDGKIYNSIIEHFFLLIFFVFKSLHKSDKIDKKDDNWSDLKDSFFDIVFQQDKNTTYILETNMNYSVALRFYIYQIWIIVVNGYKYILNNDQKQIADFFGKFEKEGLPLELNINVMYTRRKERLIDSREKIRVIKDNAPTIKYSIIILSIVLIIFIISAVVIIALL